MIPCLTIEQLQQRLTACRSVRCRSATFLLAAVRTASGFWLVGFQPVSSTYLIGALRTGGQQLPVRPVQCFGSFFFAVADASQGDQAPQRSDRPSPLPLAASPLPTHPRIPMVAVRRGPVALAAISAGISPRVYFLATPAPAGAPTDAPSSETATSGTSAT